MYLACFQFLYCRQSKLFSQVKLIYARYNFKFHDSSAIAGWRLISWLYTNFNLNDCCCFECLSFTGSINFGKTTLLLPSNLHPNFNDPSKL